MAITSPGFCAHLTCRHVMLYSPLPVVGDLLWCWDCFDYRRCVRVVRAWRMFCQTCTETHDYGTDEGRIRRTAIRHLRLNPGHQVWLKAGQGDDELIIDGQVPLPICDT